MAKEAINNWRDVVWSGTERHFSLDVWLSIRFIAGSLSIPWQSERIFVEY